MVANLVRLTLVIPWIAALYGTLYLHRVDLHWGHGICGPWGCGPPVEALLGYHAFWLVLLVPIGIAAGIWLPSSISRPAGYAILVLGCLAALGYAGWDAYRFHQQSQSSSYLVQRSLFALATAVDFPGIQVTLTGIAVLMCAKPRPGSPFLEEQIHSG